MTSAVSTARSGATPIPRWVWAALAAVLAGRVLLLTVSPLELYPDEAQYWRWAQTPDWGYFSKPPLIAWLIAVTTGMFGDAEWAVRLTAPFCHAGAAAAVIVLARRLYGPGAALLAGALYLAMPGVTLSSMVISTDTPLLAAWSAMLLAFFALRERPGWGWAATLGAAVGIGLLAKYAMIYALIAMAAAALIDPPSRAALVSRFGALAGGIAGALAAPNLIWNARNDLATLSHTAQNASWDQALFNIGELGDFLGGQLGVFGLIAFPLLIYVLVQAARGRAGREARLLALFVLVPLIVVSIQAFISRANANWAATAYPAATVLLAGYALAPRASGRRLWRGLAAAAVAANLALSLPVMAAGVSLRLADAIGASGSLKRVRGWEETVDGVLQAAADGGYRTIAFDDRFVFHATDYYGRGAAERPDLAMWMRFEAPVSYAAMCCALTGDADEPILFVSQFADYGPWLRADFGTLTEIGEISVALGPKSVRRLTLYEAAGFRPVHPRGPGDSPQ